MDYFRPKKPEKLILAERLCKLMGWTDEWSVWNKTLSKEKIKQLIQKIEGKK